MRAESPRVDISKPSVFVKVTPTPIYPPFEGIYLV